ncbi:hypothetical protein KMZ68_18550 [Bradyrhizobium sediminis]|uniref:Uncharacterized protein n=1 Tax=Bradyrhizobium sediminis TaxID=2840469 RepID=A0A975NLD8_9BRAD|nr:hypothetical protein [Bradyrhizobium sediminis]QWG16970.1 hypothetical protein KMZ68_18550 [Bradyrhizobium sediminis]
MKMRRIWWIIFPVVALCAAIAGGALYVGNFVSGFGACKTVVRSSIPSPDESKSIVIFGKECGATVGFNTQASITPAGGSFSSEKYPAFFAMSGLQAVMARWLGDDAIEIALIPGGGQVLKSEQRVGDIKVIYR